MHRRRLALTASLLALALPTSARADITGANACKQGEQVVTHYNEVYVPAYLSNAQRGDILLTSGGGGVPREIFQALHKDYNHTMLISMADDGSGNTLLTHNTAISPGVHSLEYNVSSSFPSNTVDAQWKPAHLRRMIPGNVVADTATTLVRGEQLDCLSGASTDAAGNTSPNTFADCLDARPINLWSGNNVLLRPKAPYLGQTDIITQAESIPEGTYLYAFGAYSDHLAAYNATGAEAPYGTGSMCSGFVTEAVNDALRLNGYSNLTVPPVFYSETERFSAALALHTRLYSDLMDEFAPIVGDWRIQLLTFVFNVNIDVPAIAKGMANQIVNCFASGGACDDVTDWTTVDPKTFKDTTPAPPQGGYYPVQPNTLGTGFSLSGDDLHEVITSSTATPKWAATRSTQLLGHYYYDRFAYLECCQVDPFTGEPTGSCYRPNLGSAAATATLANKVRSDLLGGSGSGAPPSGTFVETDDEYCYTTDTGSICTALPPKATTPKDPVKDPIKDPKTSTPKDPTLDPTQPQAPATLDPSAPATEELSR